MGEIVKRGLEGCERDLWGEQKVLKDWRQEVKKSKSMKMTKLGREVRQ